MDLHPEDVRSFLLKNTEFTEDFFISFATPSLIDKWFERRSKSNSVNGHTADLVNPRNRNFASLTEHETLHEENNQEVNLNPASEQATNDKQGSRRFSEPDTATRMEKKAAFKLRDMRRKKALTQSRLHSSLLDHSYDLHLDAAKQRVFHRPSLRKTQSAPICKNMLSKLINSTVYLRNFPTHDLRYKLNLRSSSEDAFLTEIIHDIMKDLNIRTLCYKVIVNVGIVTGADTASLYLVEKIDHSKVLRIYYESLPVYPTTESPDHIASKDKIRTFGEDLIGLVAETGETIRQDGMKITDSETTDSAADEGEVLCKPIKNLDGEVIGVISLGSKKGIFKDQDDRVLEKYLKFCGISITNAKLFNTSKEEFDRNKALLELAHGIFEEQTSLNNIANLTLNRALKMFACKQCSLILIAEQKHANLITEETTRYSHIFKMSTTNDKGSETKFSSVMRNSMDIDPADDATSDHVIDFVSLTGKVYNSSIVKNTAMVNGNSSDVANEPMMCVPIRDNQFNIIGVVKLIRKADDPSFNEKDEQILEAFAIFCGLGISNYILYDKVCRAKVHQKVALEVISYHTSASQLEVERLKLSSVPTATALHLYDLKFDDFRLLDDQMLTAAMRMFMEFDFLKTYQIKYETLCRWLLTVKKNYRRVIYHNFRHAFNVTQSMFAVLTTGELNQKLSSLECLALLVGCLCHDLDHRGTNNEFQTKSESPLGKLYGTSPMEHHHFNHAVAILNSEGNNIFQNLSSSEYTELIKYLKHAILATDLAQYFKCRNTIFGLIENNELNFTKKEHRNMLRGILMTACDLSGITKPWEIQKKVVHLVSSEFFHQGDIEREKLQVEPKAMMNRKHVMQLPKLQVQFFNSTGIPVYKALSVLSPGLIQLVQGATSNRDQWDTLSKKIDIGHVDPELIPVLKPVNNDEDFTYL